MKRAAGYTITELILAMGLASVIVGSATSLMYGFLKQSSNFQEWSDTIAESQLLKEDLNRMLRNTARLEPQEDLLTTGDGTYYGITNVPTASVPALCNPSQSVIRFTNFQHNKPSTRILRPWNELSHVGRANPASQLRVKVETDGLFTQNSAPEEIIIVDADLVSVRRYKVRSYNLLVNQTKDPYDDQPKKGSNGQNLMFNYATVVLDPPRTLAGAAVEMKSVNFITDSEVFAARTTILCQARADGALIQIDQTDNNKVTVLLQNPLGKYSLTNFEVLFAAPKNNEKLDTDTSGGNFKKAIYGTSLLTCVNSVQLNLVLESLQQDSSLALAPFLKSEIPPVKSSRLLFLTNYQSKRPANCF